MLHHLADDVAGVHLGVLGGARQRVAFIPHPAAARLVALRRRIRSRVRPGVKTWAHAEKSHCFRCSGAATKRREWSPHRNDRDGDRNSSFKMNFDKGTLKAISLFIGAV